MLKCSEICVPYARYQNLQIKNIQAVAHNGARPVPILSMEQEIFKSEIAPAEVEPEAKIRSNSDTSVLFLPRQLRYFFMTIV